MNKWLVVGLSAVILIVGIAVIATLAKIPAGPLIFSRSVIQGDEVQDERSPEQACAALLPEVANAQSGKTCVLYSSERIDFDYPKTNDAKCVDGASLAGCYACWFECRSKQS